MLLYATISKQIKCMTFLFDFYDDITFYFMGLENEASGVYELRVLRMYTLYTV